MSAYAAFRAQDEKGKSPFQPAEPNAELLETIVAKSNFSSTPHNSIYTESSVILGLEKDDYLIVNGLFEFGVCRGAALINNLHLVKPGQYHPFLSSSAQSLPVICAGESSDSSVSPYLPGFKTVIEFRNLHTGLHRLGQYHPPFKNMYYTPSQYTFQVVQEAAELFAVHFDAGGLKCLNTLTHLASGRDPQTIFVVGAKNCGKSTFTKALLNNLVLAGKQKVAYLDLDPGQSEFSVPWTLSLTVHDSPTFFPYFTQPHSTDDVILRYYGFSSPADLPEHYTNCCKYLYDHYCENLRPKGISLIVNTPGWIKGFGKELLILITKFMTPDQLVYLTHNDSVNLGDFQADEFEAQDNPDEEVLAGLTYGILTTVKGTRRTSKFSAAQLRIHNKLLYFHRTRRLQFDFSHHILQDAPLKLGYGTSGPVTAICALNYDLENEKDVPIVADASIMGMCMIKTSSLPKISAIRNFPMYLDGSAFPEIEHSSYKFLSLCMIHSINNKGGYLNVYISGNHNEISTQISLLLCTGYKLVLVRGDGEIPAAEVLMPDLIVSGEQIPYVSMETRKVGGVWKVRKNIGRKNQQ